MSKQNWKTGDAALVTCSDGKERIALYGTRFIDDSGVWVFPGNSLRDADQSEARPLVVIDPEDRGRVAELVTLYHLADGTTVTAMQSALREFADPKPPKPVEPTGLGAVVVDKSGDQWANLRDDTIARHDRPWMKVRNPAFWLDYAEIDVVTVLSEGVTA